MTALHQFGGKINKSVLNGKHLVVTGFEIFTQYWAIRNESDYIYEIRGLSSYAFPWLAEYFNFTYSLFQTKPLQMDPDGQVPGISTVLNEGVCDIAAAMSVTPRGVTTLDYTEAYVYVPITYLIPAPVNIPDYLAIVKPFSTWVWLGIALATLTILFFLCLFTWLIPSPISINSKENILKSTGKIANYVFRILLDQAGRSFSTSIPILILTGVWELTSFLLSNYYTTLLISYVTAPNPQPMIKSIYELQNRPDLRVVIDKGIPSEVVISTAEFGFLKVLGDKLREFPDSRCTDSHKCVEMIKSGSTVYISGKDSYLYKAINGDFKANGSCNFELGKRNLFEVGMGWAAKKKSPIIPLFDYGLIRMREAGLLTYWYLKGVPDVHQCIQTKKKGTIDDMNPVSLKGLTGAFFVLILGYGMAVFWFVGEKLYFIVTKLSCFI